ncbi:MAG: metal ABC transporter ATP-binding protein [Deltaproteobacteria bacterium]|nr:metal ABC transporter ATP-binding protein [Deltaproteobacteria bacterium]
MKDPSGETENKKELLVDLHDVWVAYDGKWVLKSVYLNCYAGEIFGIVGPNGGGKTTLLNVILGLVHPQKGSVQLFGTQPNKQSRLEVGYLPQISHADRSFPVTVLDVVLMGLYSRIGLFHRPDHNSIFHRPDHNSKKIAMDLLSQINMADHAKRPFAVLSGGQQQRVNIARAMASKPKLLVLDEPATGVDSVAQEDFYELLAKFRNEQGISVIMVSHDIGVITSHADRVACLNVELHYHDEPDSCFSPDITKKVFGKDLKVIVHDDKCATCYHRHQDHD